jgi:hypothetical protein
LCRYTLTDALTDVLTDALTDALADGFALTLASTYLPIRNPSLDVLCSRSHALAEQRAC